MASIEIHLFSKFEVDICFVSADSLVVKDIHSFSLRAHSWKYKVIQIRIEKGTAYTEGSNEGAHTSACDMEK